MRMGTFKDDSTCELTGSITAGPSQSPESHIGGRLASLQAARAGRSLLCASNEHPPSCLLLLDDQRVPTLSSNRESVSVELILGSDLGAANEVQLFQGGPIVHGVMVPRKHCDELLPLIHQYKQMFEGLVLFAFLPAPLTQIQIASEMT
ncbi:hypothetical protein E5288_WYG011594 [Bos mutus]|uniref:Uncharacterized protein n=1 Tax=Bos mutus TaxID=72004 RepID=A0A6B0RID0_9CETA|nr:hypothetical protein [Bos mutus]